MHTPNISAIPSTASCFVATRNTRLSTLGECLFLPRVTSQSTPRISFSFSDCPPNVAILPPGDLSRNDLKAALAACGIISLPCREVVAQLRPPEPRSRSYQSVLCSSSPGQFLPLWVATILLGLDNLYELQGQWIRALAWIERVTLGAPRGMERLVDEVSKSLSSLCVGRPVGGLIMTTSTTTFEENSEDLLCLLADAWLSNFNIDPLIRLMNQLVLPDSSGTRALTLEQSTALFGMSHNPTSVPLRGLSELESQIRSGDVTRVLVPAFVNENHFSLFSVCFATRSYSYSDSLQPLANSPPLLREVLIQWANQLVPGTWLTSPRGFDLPAQKDTFSCGIIVISTILSIMLGTPTWSEEYAKYFRLFWFVWSANPHFTQVRICDFVSYII